MQPEARLGHQIRAALEARGSFVFKVHGSGMMMAGLPDLIACYRGQYVGFEVKMHGNKASKVQELIHGKIRGAGGYAAVVYSVDDAVSCLDDIDADLNAWFFTH